MRNLLQDLRYGVRMLIKSPGFTAVAVLSLALGIGANTAIFSLIDSLLLKQLPVENPGQLVYFGDGDYQGVTSSDMPVMQAVSYPLLRVYQRELKSFSGVAAHNSTFTRVYLSGSQAAPSGNPEAAMTQLVSGNYFDLAGVRPLLGRLIKPEDETNPGENPVVVLDYAFWQRKFGGDAEVAGKTLLINGLSYTILGVTPPEFFGLRVGERPDLWAPLTMHAQITRQEGFLRNAQIYWMRAFGRLKPGISFDQARAEVDVVFQQRIYDLAAKDLSEQQRQKAQQMRAVLDPAARGISGIRENFAQPLILLISVVGLVLLIACANIANLLLARAASRRKEIGIRLALGAGRWRLTRQLLTESLLLSAAGGLAGVLVAGWALDLLLRMASSGPGPIPLDAAIDMRVLLFTSGLTLLTVLLFGLAPALRASNVDPAPALQVNTRSGLSERTRFGLNRGLVVVQVALSLMLLVGAGLFLKSLQRLRNVPWGFDTSSQVLVVSIDPRGAGFKQEQLVPLYESIIERVEAIPGVKSASVSLYSLLGGSTASSTANVEGYNYSENEDRDTEMVVVSPRYFETVGMRILEGRGFTARDRPGGTPVTVINRKMAERFFPNSSPIGGHVSTGDGPNDKLEIVGVVENVRFRRARQGTNPAMFLPAATHQKYLESLDIRVEGGLSQTVPAIRAALADAAPNLPVRDILTMDQRVDRVLTQQRLVTQLTAAFGLLALLLATIGLYGLMSYNVSRRTGEIGIRMALGAERANVLSLVLKESMTMVVIGAIVGLIGSAAMTRLITTLLYETSATDPAAMAISTAVLLTVAAVAGYLPARHAARTSPMVALRYE